MKASELAAILLKNPDMEVYTENQHYDSYDNDSYFTTEAVDSVVQTPDGLFLNFKTIDSDTDLKSPMSKPKLHTFRIKLKDGEYFRIPQSYHNLSTLIDFEVEGHLVFYVSWHDDWWILAPADTEDEFAKEKISYTSSTHYTPDDVECVQIITALDDKWEPIYTDFTLQDAIEFANRNTK